MNFDFSEEQTLLREQLRKWLAANCTPAVVRGILDGKDQYARTVWQKLGEMELFGCNIPEAYGGLGLGYLELCVVAEELGRVLAPVPFSSSIHLAAEFIIAAGSEAQKSDWLPRISRGNVIGTFAFGESAGPVTSSSIQASVSAGQLTGVKFPVPDGGIADIAIVAAREAAGVSLYLVDLSQPGVERATLDTIDPTRNHAHIAFRDVPVEPIGAAGAAWPVIDAVLEKAAVLMAFEQIGGADAALQLACDYARERMAFGRPIGSFQAIKHMLADMYVSTALARSNAYYGALVLSNATGDLPEAAATARVSATRAFTHCARDSIQVHGGMGFTWELDCHLYYRRAHLLGLALGGLPEWEDKLVSRLCERADAGRD